MLLRSVGRTVEYLLKEEPPDGSGTVRIMFPWIMHMHLEEDLEKKERKKEDSAEEVLKLQMIPFSLQFTKLWRTNISHRRVISSRCESRCTLAACVFQWDTHRLYQIQLIIKEQRGTSKSRYNNN